MGARLALVLTLVLAGAGWELAGAGSGSGVSLTAFPAPGAQRWPVAASDGTNFFVTWSDLRAGGWNWDVYGTRVSPGGVVLDRSGIPVSTAPQQQMVPAVAFDGSNYLVAWSDARADTSDIYGTRITAAGSVLEPSGIAISTAPHVQVAPSLAFDGTNYLVVWEDWRAGFDIYGSRVSRTGAVLDPSGIQVSQPTAVQLNPDLAFDGTNYLVAWWDDRSEVGRDIYGTRVSPTGAILDPAGIAISTAYGYQRTPAVAFGGDTYLVGWDDLRTTLDQVFGSRVTPAGSVLDVDGIQMATTAYADPGPAIAFDGTNFLVVWSDDRSGTNGDIYATRVSQTGEVLDPNGILISSAPSEQTTPTIAFGGTHYLVAWTDLRSGEQDIYGARVTPDGNVLDPAGLLLSMVPNAPPPPPFHPPPPPSFVPPPPRPPPPPPPPNRPPPRCRVPNVIGLRLATAKARIRARRCRIGAIRRVRSRGNRVGRVMGQSPRGGAVRRVAFPLSLRLGRR